MSTVSRLVDLAFLAVVAGAAVEAVTSGSGAEGLVVGFILGVWTAYFMVRFVRWREKHARTGPQRTP